RRPGRVDARDGRAHAVGPGRRGHQPVGRRGLLDQVRRRGAGLDSPKPIRRRSHGRVFAHGRGAVLRDSLMAIVTSRYTEIGRASSPSSERMLMRAVAGLALAKGDAIDASYGPTSGEYGVGWIDSNSERLYQIGYLPLPPRIRRNSRVIGATIYFAIRGSV